MMEMFSGPGLIITNKNNTRLEWRRRERVRAPMDSTTRFGEPGPTANRKPGRQRPWT
jgi:hypothetical protein